MLVYILQFNGAIGHNLFSPRLGAGEKTRIYIYIFSVKELLY